MSWKDNFQLKDFYDHHRESIIADISRLRKPEALIKWEIAPSRMEGLLIRWKRASAKAVAPAAKRSQRGTLPPLPPWNDKWPPEVMIKWLMVFETLTTQPKRREETGAKEHTAQR